MAWSVGPPVLLRVAGLVVPIAVPTQAMEPPLALAADAEAPFDVREAGGVVGRDTGRRLCV